MASLVSTDSPSPSLSSSSPDMTQVLTGIQYIMEMSVTQDTKLLDIVSILSAQLAQIMERDQSIIIMQSKLDLQRAIIDDIRSEQRQLTSVLKSFLESHAQHAQDVSGTLPPGVAAGVTGSPGGSLPNVIPPELLASQTTSKPTSDTPSDAAAHVNSRTITIDDPWKAPEYYTKTQRGGELRRQGAFYGTPDWHAMTVVSGGAPDSRASPPSPPATPKVQEEIIPAAGNACADVHKTLEAGQETEAAPSDDEDSTSDASLRSSCKRCRDLDEGEAHNTSNPMDISRIVHDAPDWSCPSLFSTSSPGLSPSRVDSNRDGPAKRRRLSQDIVGSDAVSDTKRLPTRRLPRRVTPK
ncbi:hypothetical protein DFH29DRAFT_900301 [Suillus ampliporus]|nr:hypothetical protein DFH29DRAFT_900301 [Suillus ampliporus]